MEIFSSVVLIFGTITSTREDNLKSCPY